MLLDFRTVSRHFFPHVGNLISCERLAIWQSHAHHKKFVFVNRLDLLSLLNHDVYVGRSDWREGSRGRANAILIRSRCFDLKVSRMCFYLSLIPVLSRVVNLNNEINWRRDNRGWHARFVSKVNVGEGTQVGIIENVSSGLLLRWIIVTQKSRR